MMRNLSLSECSFWCFFHVFIISVSTRDIISCWMKMQHGVRVALNIIMQMNDTESG